MFGAQAQYANALERKQWGCLCDDAVVALAFGLLLVDRLLDLGGLGEDVGSGGVHVDSVKSESESGCGRSVCAGE